VLNGILAGCTRIPVFGCACVFFVYVFQFFYFWGGGVSCVAGKVVKLKVDNDDSV